MEKAKKILNNYIKVDIAIESDRLLGHHTIYLSTDLRALRVALKTNKLVLQAVKKIKKEEEGFKSKYWSSCYFSETNKNAVHISKLALSKLNDADLVRCYSYLILTREYIIDQRVKQTLLYNHE